MDAVIQTMLTALQTEFIRHGSHEQANRYQRYFKEGYNPYGISKEAYEIIRDTFWEKCKESFSNEELIGFIDALFHADHYEEQSIAINFLESMKEDFTPALFSRISDWFDIGIRNWAHTDIISGNVLSHFLNTHVISIDDFAQWQSASLKWKRRAVPVTMISLTDLSDNMQQYLEIIEPWMVDSEKMVQKGTGWFLREAWKLRAELIEELLLKHKDTSPRLIFQYATEKMSKEERQRFRRTK